jgi:hypothetical protein
MTSQLLRPTPVWRTSSRRSFILDLPPPAPQPRQRPPQPDAANSNVYRASDVKRPTERYLTKLSSLVKILASPLRRCILTQKVMPKGASFPYLVHSSQLTRCSSDTDLMVQLKLAGTPSSPAGPSPRLVLTPSSILHPRFSLSLPGKGAWVACWKDAVDSLAQKGEFLEMRGRKDVSRAHCSSQARTNAFRPAPFSPRLRPAKFTLSLPGESYKNVS